MVEVYLENLSKHFGKVKAVDNVTLEVKDGEFTVLLGPSGCGKTTTLRLIAGLEKADGGHVYFGDELMDYVPPRKRKIGMLFQTYALFPHMSVFDNIAFPLKLSKVPKDEIKKSVREVAELLEIEALLDRKPSELSGGQQQRAALGRALAKEPNVFLLDEPLSNLDAKLRTMMRGEIKKLQVRLGSTTVYVTHDQVEAMSLADRVAVMNEGKIEEISVPSSLYKRPKSLFVAGFIGTPPMNLLDCVFRKEEGPVLDLGRFVVEIPKNIEEAIEGYSELTLGIRPRHVAVSRKQTAGAVEGEVLIMEPLGEDAVVNLDVGGETIRAIVPFTFNAKVGEKVWITLNMNKVYVFDRKTGKDII